MNKEKNLATFNCKVTIKKRTNYSSYKVEFNQIFPSFKFLKLRQANLVNNHLTSFDSKLNKWIGQQNQHSHKLEKELQIYEINKMLFLCQRINNYLSMDLKITYFHKTIIRYNLGEKINRD